MHLLYIVQLIKIQSIICFSSQIGMEAQLGISLTGGQTCFFKCEMVKNVLYQMWKEITHPLWKSIILVKSNSHSSETVWQFDLFKTFQSQNK